MDCINPFLLRCTHLFRHRDMCFYCSDVIGSLVLEVPAAAQVTDLVEVHPPSTSAVDLTGVTVRVREDSGPRLPVPPAPVVKAGTVSLTRADGEVEVYELVRQG